MIRINDKDVDQVLEFTGVDYAGGCIYHYQSKPFSGIIESFYPNGNLRDESEYTDGHIGGIQTEYFENGQIRYEWYKIFGKIDKHFKEWDIDGNLLHHSIWKEGVKTETLVG